MTKKEQYKKLLPTLKGVPLFLNDWWLDAVCVDWDVAIAYNGDNVSGVWVYPAEQKMGVSIIRTPVFTPYIGPVVFYPSDLKPTKRDSFEYEVITDLLSQIPDAKVWHISLQPQLKQAGLFNSKDFEIVVRQTYLMPLDEGEEAVFARLHEDHRRKVRKAEKTLVIEEDHTQIDTLFDFQQTTLSSKKVQIPYSKEQLKKVFTLCKEKGNATLWVARKGENVQAVVWQVWDEERSYYLMGSKNPTIKDNNAMVALLWQAIKKSISLGHKTFDFEGSMDAGVEQFFRNFGGDKQLYLVLKKNNSALWKLKEAVR
ncbi:MAG: GNAT family N-acetyltransferase [Flavipsychrobacter sp.]